jgi:hypothetical protein
MRFGRRWRKRRGLLRKASLLLSAFKKDWAKLIRFRSLGCSEDPTSEADDIIHLERDVITRVRARRLFPLSDASS